MVNNFPLRDLCRQVMFDILLRYRARRRDLTLPLETDFHPRKISYENLTEDRGFFAARATFKVDRCL